MVTSANDGKCPVCGEQHDHDTHDDVVKVTALKSAILFENDKGQWVEWRGIVKPAGEADAYIITGPIELFGSGGDAAAVPSEKEIPVNRVPTMLPMVWHALIYKALGGEPSAAKFFRDMEMLNEAIPDTKEGFGVVAYQPTSMN